MLGRKDDIADSGQLRQRSPVLRVKLAGIEGPGQVVEEAVGVCLVRADQRMRDDNSGLRIDRPVNEHAEAKVAEPFQAVGLVQRPRRHFLLGRSSGRKCDQDQCGAEHGPILAARMVSTAHERCAAVSSVWNGRGKRKKGWMNTLSASATCTGRVLPAAEVELCWDGSSALVRPRPGGGLSRGSATEIRHPC
jgi:hypothetical protein